VDVLGHDGMIYEKSANEAHKYAAFVNWLSDLHYHGYCLKGKLQPLDFGISRTCCLRGELPLLAKVNEE